MPIGMQVKLLRIVGSAVEPEPFNVTVTRDPQVRVFFADVNLDGQVGLSDILHTIEVSGHGRTITFTEGEIPIGGRFTDFLVSATSTGEPLKAAAEASFSGELPPAVDDHVADPASDYLQRCR